MRNVLEDLASAAVWPGPPEMDTGAPEPETEQHGSDLWVAYYAHDPNFPGWDDPSTTEYVHRHPGELYGVLKFENVDRHLLGPPNDESLHRHPAYGKGLNLYNFHRGTLTNGRPCWVVTFHDETLLIEARSAHFFEAAFAVNASEAIRRYRVSPSQQ